MTKDPRTYDPRGLERAIKIGCTAVEVHLACSFPECTCTTVPKAVRAAIYAWENPNTEITK